MLNSRDKHLISHIISKLREQEVKFTDKENAIKALSGCVLSGSLIRSYLNILNNSK